MERNLKTENNSGVMQYHRVVSPDKLFLGTERNYQLRQKANTANIPPPHLLQKLQIYDR